MFIIDMKHKCYKNTTAMHSISYHYDDHYDNNEPIFECCPIKAEYIRKAIRHINNLTSRYYHIIGINEVQYLFPFFRTPRVTAYYCNPVPLEKEFYD